MSFPVDLLVSGCCTSEIITLQFSGNEHISHSHSYVLILITIHTKGIIAECI